ncbi:MAG: ATP-binding cassette domain-containing protein [Acetatifactor sp.]|nr:ATP-binding cassette domain-containing protein [Acetatifactor sp.]
MKRDIMRFYLKYMLLTVVCLAFILMVKLPVMAATGAVTYGSDSYQWEEGTENPIGIYITGDETIASFEICVQYDPGRLEYVSGASEQRGNLLYIRGTGNEQSYRVMLHFRTRMAGRTNISVISASALTVEKEVPVEESVNTTVSGNEELPEPQMEMVAEEFIFEAFMAAPIAVREEGSSYLADLALEPVGLTDFSPETSEYSIEVPTDVDQLQVSYIPEDDDAEVTVSDTSLQIGENTITIEVRAGDASTSYTIHVLRQEPAATPEPAASPSPEPTAASDEQDEALEASADPEEDPEPEAWAEIDWVPVMIVLDRISDVILWISCIAVLILGIGYILHLVKERQQEAQQRAQRQEAVRVINMDQTVISVRDVTMKFKMAKDEASSLKEQLIRTIKKQNEYSYLTALEHVSFDVQQGDVIGIIGTNGSGKSTLLKIVSGALKPTSGHVEVDRSKVQILTLGTGFDMELTARENVYLNGAIIGYTKEYIDEIFDDIVTFAELEGFMDERMKNFSSGMVSRLGFAIATMRDAPDILILDEVLSVGDMFFRKKSGERIKELIHSGATVLIVSHSMDTIIKNCNKVVWIEKGKFKMMGDPQKVCAAYGKMEQE